MITSMMVMFKPTPFECSLFGLSTICVIPKADLNTHLHDYIFKAFPSNSNFIVHRSAPDHVISNKTLTECDTRGAFPFPVPWPRVQIQRSRDLDNNVAAIA